MCSMFQYIACSLFQQLVKSNLGYYGVAIKVDGCSKLVGRSILFGGTNFSANARLGFVVERKARQC